MKTKTILYILVLLITQSVLAQRKTRADRFFEKGDYTNAAKYYEEELAEQRHKKHYKILGYVIIIRFNIEKLHVI